MVHKVGQLMIGACLGGLVFAQFIEPANSFWEVYFLIMVGGILGMFIAFCIRKWEK